MEMNFSLEKRRARRLSVEFSWALENYAETNKEFRKILESDDVSQTVAPVGEGFFYRLAFVGPEGFDNDEMAKKVYEYLLANLGDREDLAGMAVNFTSSK